jgi:hypothetical protein
MTLADLQRDFPRGHKVHHPSGWQGVVTPEDPATVPALRMHLPGAHALVGGRPAVCVQWASGSGLVTAWYRPSVFEQQAKPGKRGAR